MTSAPGERARVGVMGGTFDPIHVGHLAIADAARDRLGLSRVLFLPAGIPPHKPGQVVASISDRVAMVELAIRGRSGMALSRVDVDRPGPSYTAESLVRIGDAERDAGRDVDLVLVMSAETLAGLPAWRHPDRVLDAARIAVVPRGGWPAPDPDWLVDAFGGRADRVITIDGPALTVSSTLIRERIAAGRSIRGLVPPAVARYIADHGLYRRLDPPSIATATEDASNVPDSQPVVTQPETPRSDGLPRRSRRRSAAERSSLEVARRVVELAEDKKAADIVLLDLTGLTTLADHFVVCSGGSERQIAAIADGIVDGLRDEGIRPIGREGTAASHWVLVDFGDVIVHVFTPPERDFYQLEKHWAEARTVLRVQ